LTPDETCSIPTKQEDAHLEAEAEVRGGGGKASPSLSFWAVDWAAGSDEAASPQQQPQGKTSKSNGIDRAALTSSKDGSALSSLAAFAPSSSPSSSLAASMPLSMIMSMSKQGSKSSLLLDESDDESEEEAYSHPLSSVQGMPAFSDLQGTSPHTFISLLRPPATARFPKIVHLQFKDARFQFSRIRFVECIGYRSTEPVFSGCSINAACAASMQRAPFLSVPVFSWLVGLEVRPSIIA
jgi:hypothetical protein